MLVIRVMSACHKGWGFQIEKKVKKHPTGQKLVEPTLFLCHLTTKIFVMTLNQRGTLIGVAKSHQLTGILT